MKVGMALIVNDANKNSMYIMFDGTTKAFTDVYPYFYKGKCK